MTKRANDGELIILAEKETPTSKALFNEYCKQEKTLKQIANDKGISYNTAKKYSSNYKYKERLEYKIELESKQLSEQRNQLLKEHQADIKESLDKSYEIMNLALRNTKGTLLLNLDTVQNEGIYFDEKTDYQAFNNWSKTALSNMRIANETLTLIDKLENKLSHIEQD